MPDIRERLMQIFRARRGGGLRQVGGLLAILVLALGALVQALTGWLGGVGPSDVVAGQARVIDGDSLRIGRHEIRLVGIDAPEGRQRCQRNGQTYNCGNVAREALRKLARGHIRCEVERRDQHRRLLATCFADATNINRELVTQGTAIRFGNRYRSEESAARRARRGLWAGQFERPRDWRRKNNR